MGDFGDRKRERGLQERAERELREGLKRGPTEKDYKEKALRERELKRVQERAQGRGSHIHFLLSSYILCPPKGEAAVRLL